MRIEAVALRLVTNDVLGFWIHWQQKPEIRLHGDKFLVDNCQ